MAEPYFPIPLTGFFELSSHGKIFTLSEPFTYNDPEKGVCVIVEKNFTTDFNSTPRGLWNLFPPWEYPEAAIVHDWLYRNPIGPYYWKGAIPLIIEFNRKECDDLHRRILDIEGASWVKRQSMWIGIRAGGWKPWNKYRSQD